MVVYLYTSRMWKVETRVSGVQDQPEVDMQKLDLNSPSLSPLGSTIECHFKICLWQLTCQS